MHDIFNFSQNKNGVSVVTCKVTGAFSTEFSFSKINKFIFYQIMRYSSIKSRQIINGQTGRIEISGFKFI